MTNSVDPHATNFIAWTPSHQEKRRRIPSEKRFSVDGLWIWKGFVDWKGEIVCSRHVTRLLRDIIISIPTS